MKFPLLFFALVASATSARSDEHNLKSHGTVLRLVRGVGGQFGLQLDAGAVRFEQKTPLALNVLSGDGTSGWVYGAYSSEKVQGGQIRAEGEVHSAWGTRFRFFDVFERDGDGFRLVRRVEVSQPSAEDAGFATRFGLAWAAPETTHDCDVLMPGVWYRDNKNVPPKAFAANIDNQMLMQREDRLGSPLVMARDKANGVTLELERVGGFLTTVEPPSGVNTLTDERFQMGAVGFLNAGHLEAAFGFPGTDDERPLLGPNTQPGSRYAPRWHPVKIGVAHTYSLHFEAQRTASYAVAVEHTIKAAIERAQAPLVRADLGRVYHASIDLLDEVVQPYNGTVSVPFQLSVPDGQIKDTSMQMGFVGMAIPCAALLLRDGLETHNQSTTQRAMEVVDFWAQQSATPSGVPKTWCDFPAPGVVTWRNTSTHLRVASDGMRGVLRAWDVARQHGINKPEWLLYAQKFGDFLVEHQNEDGSWFGQWNLDGTPRSRYTNASTHPLAFLIDLARTTGNAKYQVSALRAGEFCLRTVNQDYAYVGGTPDNPNVIDKEAGVVAMEGFLALFDATGERRWLDAAHQAALFCETWVYWRVLPMPATPPGGDPSRVFPRGRNTVGMSLIATGHSASDNFIAVAPFLWYRLYLATGDAHFLGTARLLLHDTKQLMDWDGALGYKYGGLMPEAMSLAANRGRGIAGWLPWLTFVVVDPLVRLQDTFGSMDIDQIEKLPKRERLRRSAIYGRTRGFGAR